MSVFLTLFYFHLTHSWPTAISQLQQFQQNGLKRDANPDMNTVSLSGSCKSEEQQKHMEQSNKASSIAEKAAVDAKAASDAQQAAAQQAAHQVTTDIQYNSYLFPNAPNFMTEDLLVVPHRDARWFESSWRKKFPHEFRPVPTHHREESG